MVEFLSEVRFLTMSEKEFIHHVIPSGVFCSDESDAVLGVMRKIQGARLPLLAPCFLTENRPQYVKRVQLYRNVKPVTRPFSLLYRNSTQQTVVETLEVTHAVYIRRFLSTGFLDMESSVLMVLDPTGNTVAEGVWRGLGCKFYRPFILYPEVKYSIKVWTCHGMSSYGEEPMKVCDCWSDIVFTGRLYYSHLVIEFMEV